MASKNHRNNNRHDPVPTNHHLHKSKNTPAVELDSNMESLLRMVPKNRAEKAIAWTGDISLGGSLDWILSHEQDPNLDKTSDREYLVYLCPSGPLWDNISDFLNKSISQCGRNGAHLHLPHITMCHAFKSHDSNIPLMLKTLKEIYSRTESRFPEKMSLERYASENFIGLFLDNHSEKGLKEFSQILVSELQTLSEQPIPHNNKKAFHLTLAYHFSPSDYDALLTLSKNINLKADCKWHFHLYSRDPKFNSHEVHQRLIDHSSKEHEDVIPFISNDFMYINPQDSSKSSIGFVPAVSWASGVSGKVALNSLQKCFDSDVWILHGILSYSDGILATGLQIPENFFPLAQRLRWVSKTEKSSGDVAGKKRSAPVLPVTVSNFGTPKHERKNGCTIYVMRHGERMDFVFGWNWVGHCFDSEGNFTRTNLNMPKSIPKRRAGAQAYVRDPPLTSMGLLQAQLTGKAMNESGVVFSRIFVSPALRSIQTATAVLEACTDKKCTKICVEPALYEWLGWVKEAHPDWLSPSELSSFGIPVDLDYHPLVATSQLNYNETVEESYARNASIVKKVVHLYAHEGGNMLFVAHASSLDTCTRELVGASPRSHFDMNKVTQRVPYCAVVSCCEGADKKWLLKNPPFPPLTHGANVEFNAVKALGVRSPGDILPS